MAIAVLLHQSTAASLAILVAANGTIGVEEEEGVEVEEAMGGAGGGAGVEGQHRQIQVPKRPLGGCASLVDY